MTPIDPRKSTTDATADAPTNEEDDPRSRGLALTAVDEPAIQRASVRRNAAQMASSQVVTWTLATITSIVVPRFLGPTALGELQLAGSLWAIASVFTALGTSMYLQLAISRDQRHGLRMVTPVFVARTGAFIAAALVLAVYVSVTGGDARFVAIMSLTGFAALLALWSDVFGAVFTGLERMSTIASVTVATRLLLLVATIAALALGLGVLGVVGASIATAFAGLVAMTWRFRKITRLHIGGWSERLWPVIVASVPFMVVTLAVTIYRQIDVIVISQIAGSRDVGWYVAADLLAGSLLFPTTVIMSTVFPTFGRLHTHDPDGLRDLVRRSFSLLFLVAVPIGLGAAIVGPSFAPLLFGDEYEGTGTALVVFGPVTILSFATTLLAYVALATDRSRFLASLLVVSAIVTVPLDMVLVPWTSDRYGNGALGGALAYVITEVMQFIVGLVVIAPYLVTRSSVWRNLRVLLAGGIMVAVTWAFRDLFFLIPAAVGSVTYALAVVTLRVLEDDQREMIGEVLRKIGISTPWAAR